MRRAALVLGIAIVLTSASAFADDEEAANDSFDRAVELFRAKKYRESAEAFGRAERLAPRGPTAYNAARAWKAAGENARAADELTQALALGNLSEEQRKDATKQLAQLEAANGWGILDLEGPKDARVRLGPNDERALPAHAHVLPGTLQVFFKTTTATDEQTVKVAKGEHVAVKMRIVTSAPPPPPIAPIEPVAQPAGPPPDHRVRSSDVLTRKNAGIASIVGGVIIFGVGVYVGLDGKSARDKFVNQGNHNRSLHDQAESERIWANVLGVVGIGVAGLGTYLLLTPSQEPAPPAAAPRSAKPSLAPSHVAVQVGPGGVALAGELF